MNLKNSLIILLVAVVAAYAAGRYLQPPKIETQYVDREIVKKDVKTVIKEVIKSDGSKETTTVIDDQSSEKKDTKYTVTVPVEKLYAVGIAAKIESITSTPNYVLQVSRRVLGPISTTISASTDKQFGLGVSYEF